MKKSVKWLMLVLLSLNLSAQSNKESLGTNISLHGNSGPIFEAPHSSAVPGETICIPIRVKNYSNIVSGTFSLQWNTAVLQYLEVNMVNPLLDTVFSSNGSTNSTTFDKTQVNSGSLGCTISNSLGLPTTLDNHTTLFEICFKVTGQLLQGTKIYIADSPTPVLFKNGTSTVVIKDEIKPLTLTSFRLSVVDTTCLGTGNLLIKPVLGAYPFDFSIRRLNSTFEYLGSIDATEQFFKFHGVGFYNFETAHYEVCLRDGNGTGTLICDTIPVSIEQPSAQIATTSASCYGIPEGKLEAVLLMDFFRIETFKKSQYKVQWSSAFADPGAWVQNDVLPGTYFLTMTDVQKSCSFTASTFLGPGQLKITSTVTAASAQFTGDGSISIVVNGGTMPLHIAWSNGVVDTTLIDQLLPGTYSCTITDANDCELVEVFEVTAPVSSVGETEPIRCMLSPNPASTVATLQLSLQSRQKLELLLINSMGEVVWKFTDLEFKEGNVDLPINKCPAGLYRLILVTQTDSKSLPVSVIPRN